MNDKKTITIDLWKAVAIMVTAMLGSAGAGLWGAVGSSGAANTGNGGQGAGTTAGAGRAGSGGSGIVIIRYLTSDAMPGNTGAFFNFI